MSTSSNKSVQVNITWVPPSARNGPFSSLFILYGNQSPPYPPEKGRSTSVTNVTLLSDQTNFSVPNALAYAEYSATVQPFNIKTGNKAEALTEIQRSIAIGKSSK